MTIKDSIINSYNLKSSRRKLNNIQKTNLLFDITLEFITKYQWTYFPDGHEYSADFMLGQKNVHRWEVNCFELSDLFIALCEAVGLSGGHRFVYKYKPTSKIGQQLDEPNSESKYKFQCFDKQFAFTDNQECFDQHCVAIVNGRFYDLVFSCSYKHKNVPYDVDPFAKTISFL